MGIKKMGEHTTLSRLSHGSFRIVFSLLLLQLQLRSALCDLLSFGSTFEGSANITLLVIH